MNKVAVSFAAAVFFLGLGIVWSQGPAGKGDFKKGPGFEKKGMMPGFELGKVLPPHIADTLDLSEDQLKQIADLEKEVKSKMTKILSEDQRKKIQNFKDKGPPFGKDGGKDKDKDKEKGKKKDGAPERPDFEKKAGSVDSKKAVIVWFSSIEAGLGEARRTGKPILLVSAAPHCAGVSGTW